MTLRFSRQIKKHSNIKFHKNPSVGALLFQTDGRAGGQTDRHDEVNSRFSQFCESVQKLSSYLTENTLRVCQKANLLLLFRRIAAIYCDNHIKLVGLIWNF
jgi:hypothetical protein